MRGLRVLWMGTLKIQYSGRGGEWAPDSPLPLDPPLLVLRILCVLHFRTFVLRSYYYYDTGTFLLPTVGGAAIAMRAGYAGATDCFRLAKKLLMWPHVVVPQGCSQAQMSWLKRPLKWTETFLG